MKYISTRGQTAPMDFSEVLLMGLAPDGGLMLPEHYPNIDSATLTEWRALSYPQLAMAIMQRFATDIPAADLQDIIERTYTAEVFGSDDIVPVRKLQDDLYILGLSNGPTLAFKDVAISGEGGCRRPSPRCGQERAARSGRIPFAAVAAHRCALRTH